MTDVRVWLASLDDPVPPQAAGSLSPEELSRAAGFADPVERNRFVASHAILRALLSRYAGERPDELKVTYPRAGKPFLNSRRVKFSLSHSHGVGLFAFSKDLEVGVDIEKEVWFPGAPAVAQRFLREGAERGDFFGEWTREEASLKARGLGVSHMGRHPAGVPAPQEPNLHVHEVRPNAPYVAALAVEGSECIPRLAHFRWPDAADTPESREGSERNRNPRLGTAERVEDVQVRAAGRRV